VRLQGNVDLETGRSADGVVTFGTPRLLLGGLRGCFCGSDGAAEGKFIPGPISRLFRFQR